MESVLIGVAQPGSTRHSQHLETQSEDPFETLNSLASDQDDRLTIRPK